MFDMSLVMVRPEAETTFMQTRSTVSIYLYYLLTEFVVVGVYLGVVVPELREELLLEAAQRRAFLLSAVLTAFVAWIVSFGTIGLLVQRGSGKLQRTILALLVTFATLAVGTWVGYTVSTDMAIAEVIPTLTLPAESPSSTPLAASHTPRPASTSTPATTHTVTPEVAITVITEPAPTITHGSPPTWTPTPTGPVIRAIAEGTFSENQRQGLWVIIKGDPYARFLPFEELGSRTPSWERGLGNCQKGEDILAAAASSWQDGIVAVLSDEELCVVGPSLLWSIPISQTVPPQRQVQEMTMLDDLVLVGTDFGLYQYDLADLTGGEVRLSDDETLLPYGVTALDKGSEGVCLGTLHYLSDEPYRVWYSSNSQAWTLMDFPEVLSTFASGMWCSGPERGTVVLGDGRWFSLDPLFPSNPIILGRITEVAFSGEGSLMAALLADPEPSLCWASSESNGWHCPASFPPLCRHPLSLVIGESKGESVVVVGCSEGIYYWQTGDWQSVVLPGNS